MSNTSSTPVKKIPWTPRQLSYLRKHYADTPMEVLVKKTKHSVRSIYCKARVLKLYRSKEYLAQFGFKVNTTEGARRNRFKKGCTSFNKGKRIHEFMSEESIEKCRRNWYKKGHRPYNKLDIGTEVQYSSGYVYIKVDNGRLVPKHRYVWEQAHGPIPDGHIVVFRDGDRTNCDLDNLYLTTRTETIRQYFRNEPAEARKSRLTKAHAKRNKTIRRDKLRLHWGLEPLSNLVKKW